MKGLNGTYCYVKHVLARRQQFTAKIVCDAFFTFFY